MQMSARESHRSSDKGLPRRKTTRNQTRKYLYYSLNDIVYFLRALLVRHVTWWISWFPFWLIPQSLRRLVSYPVSLLYFFYIQIPVSITCSIWTFLTAVVLTVSRRNTHTRQLSIQITSLWCSLLLLWESLINVKLSELLLTVLQSIFEVFSSWPHGGEGMYGTMRQHTRVDGSNLLFYEERENAPDGGITDPYSQRRIRSQMHNFVPSNPFRAVIKGIAELDEADSPASFPPTPFSRARVMSHSTERVVSTMFAARDRLRMEAQSASRDEYSRKAAVEAQSSGQMAVFDQRQTSDGLALTCGAHCILKVGKGMVCSSRAMMPVRPNTFVYLEFSVTAQAGQIPLLALGFAPPECPLNVMVGAWPKSISLYQDGQLLVGSKWFQGSGSIIEAGSTVGFLVYLPSDADQQQQAQQSRQQSEPLDPQLKKTSSPTAKATLVTTHPTKLTKVQASAARRVSADEGTSTASISCSDGESKTTEMLLEEQATSAPSHLPVFSSAEASCTSPELSVPTPFTLCVSVNGRSIAISEEVREAANDALLANDAPLFPTISLLSQDTRVWCRFCEEDIMYRSRAQVKAPPGVKVYCLDGSLLLDNKD